MDLLVCSVIFAVLIVDNGLMSREASGYGTLLALVEPIVFFKVEIAVTRTSKKAVVQSLGWKS